MHTFRILAQAEVGLVRIAKLMIARSESDVFRAVYRELHNHGFYVVSIEVV